jgi:hypothetical protein
MDTELRSQVKADALLRELEAELARVRRVNAEGASEITLATGAATVDAAEAEGLGCAPGEYASVRATGGWGFSITEGGPRGDSVAWLVPRRDEQQRGKE